MLEVAAMYKSDGHGWEYGAERVNCNTVYEEQLL